MQPHSAELPTAEFGRYIRFSEIARTSEVQIDTIVVWHRLIIAMGYDFGEKQGNAWTFSAHEFYILSLAGSLSRAGFPVGMEILRQLVLATQDGGRPEKPLALKTPGAFAIIAIDAPALWDAAANMLARAERNAS